MAKFTPTRTFKLEPGKSWKQTRTGLAMCRCGRGYRTERVQHPDAGQRVDGTMDTLHLCALCAKELYDADQEALRD